MSNPPNRAVRHGGRTNVEFVYGSYVDEVLCYQQTVGGIVARYYPHYNHLYSVAALTDSTGAVVERYKYDAYGRQTITSAGGVSRSKSAVGFDRGFTGYITDNETGLMYARMRMYSPGLGRFVRRDPLGYVDGPLLYSAYFVPNALDPSGTAKACDNAGAMILMALGYTCKPCGPQTDYWYHCKKKCAGAGLGPVGSKRRYLNPDEEFEIKTDSPCGRWNIFNDTFHWTGALFNPVSGFQVQFMPAGCPGTFTKIVQAIRKEGWLAGSSGDWHIDASAAEKAANDASGYTDPLPAYTASGLSGSIGGGLSYRDAPGVIVPARGFGGRWQLEACAFGIHNGAEVMYGCRQFKWNGEPGATTLTSGFGAMLPSMSPTDNWTAAVDLWRGR